MKLETRFAEAADVPELKRMIDECLAVDYYSVEKLQQSIQGERNLFYVVTDADRDGAIAAFFYAFFSTLGEALKDLHVDKWPPALRAYDPETTVGIYKTVSTGKEYRRSGICSSFVRRVEPVMGERGAKLILVPAMRSPAGVVPAKDILQDNGFVPVAEIIRPWNDMELYCPYCGHYHCICDAVFYIKHLDGTEDEDVRE